MTTVESTMTKKAYDGLYLALLVRQLFFIIPVCVILACIGLNLALGFPTLIPDL
jgi:hypothetical protein